MAIDFIKGRISYKIVNVVVTGALCKPVDLELISEIFPKEALYEPTAFHPPAPVYFKSKDMEGKVSIFASGKMISVGTKSETRAIQELELVAELLADKGLVEIVKHHWKIQNIVVAINFGINIDLERLYQYQRIIYEPEQFPGAILRFENPFKASILLFASGKAIITGLKSLNQVEPTIQKIINFIEGL